MGIPNTIGFNTEIVNFWVIKMGTPIWKAPHIYICIMNILCDSDIYIYTHYTNVLKYSEIDNILLIEWPIDIHGFSTWP